MSVPMTTAGRALETAAIEVAEAYATMNGYARGSGARLVLAGMAIMAVTHDGTDTAFLAGYLGTFPDARGRIEGWAARLDAAAREPRP